MDQGQRVADATRSTIERLYDSAVAESHTRFDKAAPARPKSKGWRYISQTASTAAPLLAADLLSVAGAFLTALLAVSFFLPEFPLLFLGRQTAALAAIVLLVFPLLGLYPGAGLNPIVEFRQSIMATTLTFGLVVVANSTLGMWRPFEFWTLGLAWTFSLAFVPLTRMAVRRLVCKKKWWPQPLLIIGDGPAAESAFRSYLNQPTLGLRPVGIIGSYQEHWDDTGDSEKWYLGPPDELDRLVKQHNVLWAILVMDFVSRGTINVVTSAVPNVVVLNSFDGLPSLWNRTQECLGRPGIQVQERLLLPLPRVLKRAMDLVLGIGGGLVISPLLLTFCVLIKLTSPGPIFYKQRRFGRDGEVFWMWKFRSMVPNADEVLQGYLEKHPDLQAEWDRDHKLKKDPRVTWLGRILRKTSLDELPQLWNVIRGDMSFVGPRPIVDNEEGRPYLEEHPEGYRQYTRVVPGITGMWQISGRNLTTYGERIRLDSYYIRNWSPWLDLYILVRTIRVVLRGEGAY